MLWIPTLATVIGCGGAPQPPASEAPAATAPPAAAPTPAATAVAAAPKIDPTNTEDCKQVAQASTGDDPAAAGRGTGTSDRKDPIAELIKQKRPGFRCCFDIWANKIPEAKLYVKVAMVVEIDAAGALKSAKGKPVEGGPMVPTEVESCIEAVAGSLTYPASPSGKITTFTYPFDFKPRGKR